MPVGKRSLWLSLITVALLAAVVSPFVLRRSHTYYTDGADLREPEERAHDVLREVLWEDPVALEGEVRGAELDEYEPRVSPDGALLVFTRGRPGDDPPGERANLWVARWERGNWVDSRPFSEINSEKDDLGACFSADGNALFFYSNRAGGHGGFDIWVSTLLDGGWDEPVNLGPELNSAWNEISPALSPDGRRLYFASDRQPGREDEGPWKATIRESLRTLDYDIYVATVGGDEAKLGKKPGSAVTAEPAFAAGPFTAPKKINALSFRGSSEGALAVSPAGDFLYFSSNRPGGAGGFDLYRARLINGAPWPPESLGPQVNTSGDELDPALTARGFQLYFVRSRGGTEDIFVTASREVFLVRERGKPYWSASALFGFLRDLIARIHPAILGLLLSVLVCALFLLLFRKRFGALGLLSRCFLLALLVHLLLAVWMNTQEVQRLILEALPVEERHAPFEISLGGSPEENIGMAIREALADTGGDEAPALTLAPSSRREEALPQLLEHPPEVESPERMPELRPLPADRPRAEVPESAPLALAFPEAEANEPPPPAVELQPTAPRPSVERVRTILEVERRDEFRPDITPVPVDLAPAPGESRPVAREFEPPPTPAPRPTIPDAPLETGLPNAVVRPAEPLPPAVAAREIPVTPPPGARAVETTLDVEHRDEPRAGVTPVPFDLVVAPPERQPSASMLELSPSPAPHSTTPPVPPLEAELPEGVPGSSEPLPPAVTSREVPVAPVSGARIRRAALKVDRRDEPRSIIETVPVTSKLPPGERAPTSSGLEPPASPSLAPRRAPPEVPLAARLPERIDPSSDSEPRPPAVISRALPATSPVTPTRSGSEGARLAPARRSEEAPATPQIVVSPPLPRVPPGRAPEAPEDDLGEPPPAVVAPTPVLPPRDRVAVSAPPEIVAKREVARSADTSRAVEPKPTLARRSTARREVEPAKRATSVEGPHSAAREPLDEKPRPRLPPPEDLSSLVARGPRKPEALPQPLPAVELGRVERASSFRPRLYRLRTKDRRQEALVTGGGSPRTELAVERGLKWLALHQSPDGRWSLPDYAKHLRRPAERDLYHPDWNGRGRRSSRGGSGKARNGDTAATGLALLAFLGHGESHVEDGPYRETLARGLQWLLRAQRPDGDLRGGGNLYTHGIASFALCEAYAFTRDPQLRTPAQRAIDFTVKSQNPKRGGWRYDPYPGSSDVDTSVFGWMLMAVKSARLGGLDVDRSSLKRAAHYLDSARMTRAGGRYAYQPGNSRTSPAMTAQGFFCQQLLADSKIWDLPGAAERLRRASNESVRYILSHPPRAADQEGVNFYYWYYATLALFQVGGVVWEAWNKELSELLIRLQVGEEHGTAAGSWDPRNRRALTGGRVYSTALSILCLESYYRYARFDDDAGGG